MSLYGLLWNFRLLSRVAAAYSNPLSLSLSLSSTLISVLLLRLHLVSLCFCNKRSNSISPINKSWFGYFRTRQNNRPHWRSWRRWWWRKPCCGPPDDDDDARKWCSCCWRDVGQAPTYEEEDSDDMRDVVNIWMDGWDENNVHETQRIQVGNHSVV